MGIGIFLISVNQTIFHGSCLLVLRIWIKRTKQIGHIDVLCEGCWLGKWIEGFLGSSLQSALQFYHFSATVIFSGRWSLSHELNNYSLMYISSSFLLTLFKFELKLDSFWEYCHWKNVFWSFYLSDCEGAFWKSIYCRNWILSNAIPSRECDMKAEGDFSRFKILHAWCK